MTKEIGFIKNTGIKKVDLTITSFYGGISEGEMVQITQGIGTSDEPGFIQLTPRDTYLLISKLAVWIKEISAKKAASLQQEIDNHKELQKTVFDEAVKCERFIEDLKILEVPLYLLGDKNI